MSTVKNCKNCGADNDPLMTACVYCKSPLPETNLNSISNEELLLNAGEWIGKVGQDFQHMTENYNTWTGKGMITISSNQLEGMAQKYLSLLQLRCVNNPNLQPAYTDLKNEFDRKRSNFFYKLGGGDKRKGTLILVFIIIVAIIPIALATV